MIMSDEAYIRQFCEAHNITQDRRETFPEFRKRALRELASFVGSKKEN